ncbi:MAG TPA: CDP-alcohol phosphatidyltransferase family protein [Gemmataceae bacterium]|nr:CDP-alcohol phosphatidyltransferase family protein [Gemmataceae bacterium]
MSVPRVALPLGLTLFRLILGPAMLAIAWLEPNSGPWLALCLIPAILSDLFDGSIARRRNVAFTWMRRLDSQTDLLFWLCVLGCIAILHLPVIRRHWPFILGMLVLEATIYMFSFARFGREPCTHAYSAKAWSVFLVACFGVMLAWGEEYYALPILFGTYVVSWLDVILILSFLPTWRNDVPSCWHAFRQRQRAASANE